MTHRLSIEELRQRLTGLRDSLAEQEDELERLLADLWQDSWPPIDEGDDDE